MKITDIQITLADTVAGSPNLRAFATIVLDDTLAVHDLRVVDGPHGRFVAFPSVKARLRCPSCGEKNPFSNLFCGRCGIGIDPDRAETELPPSPSGAPIRHHDVCHPINARARRELQEEILAAYDRVCGGGDAYGDD